MKAHQVAERRVSSRALVGRGPERAALAEAIAAAGAGEPVVVLVGGEAGVGKTRLTGEAAITARDRGALVLRGASVEMTAGELPYGPLVAALRDLPRDPEHPRADDIRTVRRELGERLTGEAGGSLDPDQGQAHVFETLLRALRRLARRGTLVLLLEDVHWADASTLDFLRFLVRNLGSEPLAAIATYRSDEADRPVRGLLADLIRAPAVRRLTLAPLTADDVRAQAEDILGAAPAPDLARAVVERADGNPFFVEELLARGVDAGTVPTSLNDALLLRVEALGVDAQDLVRAAAVTGRAAGQETLAEVAGLSPRAASRALREAASRAVLAYDADDGTFRVRHTLTAEAVYADLLPGERADLHRRLAERLTSGADTEAAELARHWEAAGEAAPAVRAALRAGAEAEAVFAFDEARVHLGRALRLWDEAGIEDEDRVGVMTRAAEAERLAGDYEAAAALASAALDLVDPEADPVRAAALHERLARYRYWDDDAVLASCERALALLPAEPPSAARARVLVTFGEALLGLYRCREAVAACREAVDAAERADAGEVVGAARANLGIALGFLGETDEAAAHLDVAQAAADADGRAEDVARVVLCRAELHRLLGETRRALDVTLAGREQVEALGIGASFGGFMDVGAALDLLWLGRWEEADARLERVADVELNPTAETLRVSVAALLAVGRGDRDAAEAWVARVRERLDGTVPAEFVPPAVAAVAGLELLEGRPEAALSRCEEGIEAVAGRSDPLNTPLLHGLAARAAAEAALAARDRRDEPHADALAERGAATVRALEALIDDERFGGYAPPEARAELAAARAELARVGRPAEGTGDTADAAAAWAAAEAAWTAHGVPADAAYAALRCAEARLDAGDRDGGAEALARAAALAAPLGPSDIGEAIDALARRARLTGRLESAAAPAPAPQDEPFGLTPRERDVVPLLVEGLTNRQIAERLWISPKTAGIHVSNILSKLGARNRVEAAAIAERSALVDP